MLLSDTQTTVVRENCEVDGRNYTEGAKFFPNKSPCLSCVCKSGFTGNSVTVSQLYE